MRQALCKECSEKVQNLNHYDPIEVPEGYCAECGEYRPRFVLVKPLPVQDGVPALAAMKRPCDCEDAHCVADEILLGVLMGISEQARQVAVEYIRKRDEIGFWYS